jgi:hypothetical protein
VAEVHCLQKQASQERGVVAESCSAVLVAIEFGFIADLFQPNLLAPTTKLRTMAPTAYNARNPAVKRILQEIKEVQADTSGKVAICLA